MVMERAPVGGPDRHHMAGPPCDRRRGEGFTMIEVMVAATIVMIAVVSLGAVLARSFSSVGFSRQDQQASSLASSVLAQVEALPWQTAQLTLASGTTSVTTLAVSPLVGPIRAGDTIV